MDTYLEIIYRTIFLYIIILIIFRLMGKREVGKLSIIDFVVSVLIAECVAFSLEDMSKPLFQTILPIIILFIIQYVNSLLSLKNKKVRDLIDGDPSLIIKNGVINEAEMRKQRYNLDDLLLQLREERVTSINNVKYAYLEPSGKISIFLNDNNLVLPLIVDGNIIERHLKMIEKDERWLQDKLKSKGYTNINEIFYCCYEDYDVFVQLKVTASS